MRGSRGRFWDDFPGQFTRDAGVYLRNLGDCFATSRSVRPLEASAKGGFSRVCLFLFRSGDVAAVYLQLLFSGRRQRGRGVPESGLVRC
jgi:hypothetical protein